MEVIAAKVPLIEAFGKRKCHQSCQSWPREKITGPEADQDTCWDCATLELASCLLLFFSRKYWGGRGRRGEGKWEAECGVAGTWAKDAQPGQRCLFCIPRSTGSMPVTPMRLAKA